MWATVILVWVACSAGSVSAETTSLDVDWKFGPELYFWGASIGGESADGSDVDVDLDDILYNLKLAVMGTAAVSKGEWSLAADLIYLDAEADGPIAPGVNANVKVTNWDITPVAGYNVVNTDRGRLDIVGGSPLSQPQSG